MQKKKSQNFLFLTLHKGVIFSLFFFFFTHFLSFSFLRHIFKTNEPRTGSSNYVFLCQNIYLIFSDTSQKLNPLVVTYINSLLLCMKSNTEYPAELSGISKIHYALAFYYRKTCYVIM